MRNKSNITGRDSFIIARALAMSIAVMPRLPELFQAPSDRDDMLKLLFAIAKNDAQHELIWQRRPSRIYQRSQAAFRLISLADRARCSSVFICWIGVDYLSDHRRHPFAPFGVRMPR